MKVKRNKYGINPETGKVFHAQWEVILHYLREFPTRGITSLEAIHEFGFTRLSAVVYQIKERAGIILPRAKVIVPTRYGGAVEVTRYWIEKPEAK
ncbi:MAG: hypothetical protein J6T35_01390 [Bacteroidales bacterium]|nr:hypothetical protein [Bacteroidales bacterium]